MPCFCFTHCHIYVQALARGDDGEPYAWQMIALEGEANEVFVAFDRIADRVQEVDEEAVVLRFLIPKSRVAFLVGANGAHVRHVGAVSKARIFIPATADADEEPVTVCSFTSN